ncbi:COG3650 family protein [Pseudomonas sp. MBLB4123]|uniref:COG3650 family protein n=1 Tax=Pseudomonas sp. MBLB4123 TaxID=3451557 RepID=UPI003F74F13A
MPTSRPLLFALLPLFASCQVFESQPGDAGSAEQTRLQGELSQEDGQLLLRPCQEQRRFVIEDVGATDIMAEATELLAGGSGPLFADVRGSLAASQQNGVDGQLNLARIYRLQHEGRGCDDPNFKRSTLHASGQEPGWSVTVGAGGLMLERQGQAAQALPFLEERLPEGRLNLTSEANGQRLELWVAPQRCVDPMSGAVQHLAAELRLNGEVLRGCGYYGGARSD